MKSIKWTLNKDEICRWTKNALIFLAPVILIYLGSVQVLVQDDGFQWSDFQITSVVFGAMVLYLTNTIIDILRKLSEGTK